MRIVFVLSILAACSLTATSAVAECASTDRIYIDPRLVPPRPGYTREEFAALLASPWVSEALKNQATELMLHRGDPIQMPYGEGYVLINPLNPCVQQYIPGR